MHIYVCIHTLVYLDFTVFVFLSMLVVVEFTSLLFYSDKRQDIKIVYIPKSWGAPVSIENDNSHCLFIPDYRINCFSFTQ